MNKQLALKIVNPLLFVALIIQALTGVTLAFHLFFSKPKLYEMIGELHEHTGFVFVVLAAIHLYLNWGWVKSQFAKRKA
jgi:cytochrome b